jgi:hypothetical protein
LPDANVVATDVVMVTAALALCALSVTEVAIMLTVPAEEGAV